MRPNYAMKLSLASLVALFIPGCKACSLYEEGRTTSGCGNPAIDATMLPFSGPGVGGTVIQITNTKYCLNEGVNVYCRFESGVVAGVRVNDSTIECVSPPSNGVSSTEVSYAVFMPDCHYDPAEVQWNIVSDVFDYYDGVLAGVVLTPTFGNDESARLIFAERPYNFKWNSDALLLSAMAGNAVLSSLSIDLEVVAYIKNNINQDLYCQVIQTLKHISPKDTSTITGAVSSEAIAPAINSYVDGIEKVGFIIVRIVAYTETFQVRRVHATRSSKLIGILPEDTDTTTNSCPVAPLDHCDPNSNDTPPPCPTTYTYAENDFDFYPDVSCIHSLGGAECVVESDLDNDHLETCQEYEDHPDYAPDFLKYCEGMDLDRDLSENCDCNYFHSGAVGCVRNGQSQCCYSESGGLIMDPVRGGGTRDCASNGYLNHFLYDILPYIYCCILNDSCLKYYVARPGITDENYEVPHLSYTFGDPHLESFDHVNFDFNGFGEYVAFCGELNGDVKSSIDKCQPNSDKVFDRDDTISVHFRFARLEESHLGTVTVGVAIEDKTFRKGEQALTVVTHPKERLVVYDGSDLVKFSGGNRRSNKKKKKSISGAVIYMTPVTIWSDFDVRITFKSGLMLRIRENGLGVMTVGFLKQPEGNNNQLGLLGTPDDDDTNDFTKADGEVLDMMKKESTSQDYEDIFLNFGKTWMVQQKSSSLFRDLTGSYDFNMFYFPDYLPEFTDFGADEGRLLAAGAACNEDICGKFEGYLKKSCCFDYAVTKDTNLVSAIMVDAERDDAIKTILRNSPPVIEGGRKQNLRVEMGETASFIIEITDKDGDSITATLENNDGNLFGLSLESSNTFRLSFAGTQIDDKFLAQVGISDGTSTILFNAKVVVKSPRCSDEESFKYENKKRKCSWVGKKESRLQEMCSEEIVRKACRVTCGRCCEDDTEFMYDNKDGDQVDCAWTEMEDLRSEEYCVEENVQSHCRKTCKTCNEKSESLNDKNFRLDRAKNRGSCAWIADADRRRVKYCVNEEVRTKCPVACGLSCEDDQNFSFITNDGMSEDCGWIAVRASRITTYCPQPLVSASCARTCNSCKTYIER